MKITKNDLKQLVKSVIEESFENDKKDVQNLITAINKGYEALIRNDLADSGIAQYRLDIDKKTIERANFIASVLNEHSKKLTEEAVSGDAIDYIIRLKDEMIVDTKNLIEILGKFMGGSERDDFAEHINRHYDLTGYNEEDEEDEVEDLDFWDLEEYIGEEAMFNELLRWYNNDNIMAALDANELSPRFIDQVEDEDSEDEEEIEESVSELPVQNKSVLKNALRELKRKFTDTGWYLEEDGFEIRSNRNFNTIYTDYPVIVTDNAGLSVFDYKGSKSTVKKEFKDFVKSIIKGAHIYRTGGNGIVISLELIGGLQEENNGYIL